MWVTYLFLFRAASRLWLTSSVKRKLTLPRSQERAKNVRTQANVLLTTSIWSAGMSSSCYTLTVLLQRTHSNGTGSCVCRRDMRWNPLALECQLFLDLDCSSFTYSSTVHPQVAAAATQLWSKQHGWTDEEDKKRKILALPRYFSK